MTRWLTGRAPRLRVLALLLAAGVAFAAVGMVSSQGGHTVSIEDGEVPEGGSQVTRLSALDAGDPALCAVTVDVKYDRLVNVATDCHADPEGNFVLALCNPDYAWGTVRVAAVDVDGLTGDIPLMDITWCALGGVGDSTDLDVQIVSFKDCSTPPAEITPVADQDGVNAIVTGSPPVDSDGDGFDDCPEAYLGTDPLDDCPDDASDDAWPLDLNMDTQVNLFDAMELVLHLPSVLGDPEYDKRFDLYIDGSIDLFDLMTLAPYLDTQCP